MSIFKNKYNELWAGWKIIIVLSLFSVITFVLTIFAQFAYATAITILSTITDTFTINQKMMNDRVFNAIIGLIQNSSMVFTAVIFWKIFNKRPLRCMGLPHFKHGAKDFVYGLIFGAANISVVFIVLFLTGQIFITNELLKPNFSWSLLADFIFMVFVGFGEEIFARGYCMSVLIRSNAFLILVIPNIIFALLHRSNNYFSFIPLVNIFLIGVLLSLMFLRRRSIWMPIGYHITWNFFQGSIFGLPVSGIDISGLYTSKLISINIFNGGKFGPEGGLAVTMIITVSIILFYLLAKNKSTVFETNLPM